jgi:hypothetical protein
MSGEIEVISAGGGRILSMRNTNKNTPGIRLDSDDPLLTLKANYNYRVKLEYRTENGVKSWIEAHYSTDPKHVIAKKNLPDTHGEWSTAALDLEPKVEMPLFLTVCNDGKNTARIFLKKVDVLDPRTSFSPNSTGQYLLLPFEKVATACTSERLFSANNSQMIDFEEWGPKNFNQIPFFVVDPANGTKNIILLNGSQGQVPPSMPKRVDLPVNVRVKAFHVLGGVAGWGWPYAPDANGATRGAPEGAVSVIARVRYTDGTYEDHEWKNGEHQCDYGIGNNADKFATMTGSILAFELKGNRQVRYLTVRPFRTDVVKEIEFLKGPDDDWTAPMIVAVTVERAAEPKK